MFVEVMTNLRKSTFPESHQGFPELGRQAEGHFRANWPVDKAVLYVNNQNRIALEIAVGSDIRAFKAARFQTVAEKPFDRLFHLARNVVFLSHAANIVDIARIVPLSR
ncbi:hypothetical protein PH547_20975 [Rhizobium sp. CNPSo 3464]|uniref:hypothetical protein n=1 Tax=Rhizobium sp. CNPSo 3464 TaxID=3021406 RepID=UPI00254EF057|nr:hypothetical protein [Rhizobium sp. CNPSo 3464]MDK4741363.1 hypothetical protein [Rhizobium sp. CNPSo 3464]